MKDIYTGVFEALGSRITVWYLPSLVGVSLFAFFVFPEAEEEIALFEKITEELSATDRVFLIAFIALIVAIIAQALSRPLYRLLEGYYWPNALGKERRTESHRAMRHRLLEKSKSAANPDLGRIAEKLRMYPSDESSFLPTRLGNSLRAAEDYGTDRYGLDVSILWHRIFPVASEELRELLRVTRDGMDRWISAYAVAVLFAVTTGSTAIVSYWSGVWLALAVALVSAPLWYSLAVRASADYGQSLRALADVSRIDLAASLGLDLPLTIDEERRLWTALTGIAAWGPGFPNTAEWDMIIDRARTESILQEPLVSSIIDNGDGTWSWQIVGSGGDVLARDPNGGYPSGKEAQAALSGLLEKIVQSDLE